MKSVFVFSVLTLLSATMAFAATHTGNFGCEVRTNPGGDSVASKTVELYSMTASSSVVIGQVNGATISVTRVSEYYNGAGILLIQTNLPDGTVIDSMGTSENLVRSTVKKNGLYFDSICRESVQE